MSRDQELPNPGLTVTFIDKIEDVTEYVMRELEKDKDPNSMNYLSPRYLMVWQEKKRENHSYRIILEQMLRSKPFMEATNTICLPRKSTQMFVW